MYKYKYPRKLQAAVILDLSLGLSYEILSTKYDISVPKLIGIYLRVQFSLKDPNLGAKLRYWVAEEDFNQIAHEDTLEGFYRLNLAEDRPRGPHDDKTNLIRVR